MEKRKRTEKIDVRNLPLDCVAEVTNFLESQDDFFSLMKSNTYFFSMFFKKEFFGCKNILFKVSNLAEKEEIQEPLSLSPIPYVRNIIFHSYFKSDHFLKTAKIFELFELWSYKFIHLDSLSFENNLINLKRGTNEQNLKFYLEGMDEPIKNRLKEIHLNCCCKDAPGSAEIFSLFKNLKHLDMVFSVKLDTFKANYFQSLRKLTYGFSDKELVDIKSFLRQCSLMPKLEICSFSFYSNQKANFSFSGLQQVKELYLSAKFGQFELNDQVFSGMKNLKILELENIKLTERLFYGLQKLEILNLDEISSPVFVYLMKECFVQNVTIFEALTKVNLRTLIALSKTKSQSKLKLCCDRFFDVADFRLLQYDEKLQLVCRECSKCCNCETEVKKGYNCESCDTFICQNCSEKCNCCGFIHCQSCLNDKGIHYCGCCGLKYICKDDHSRNCNGCGIQCCTKCIIRCTNSTKCFQEYCENCWRKARRMCSQCNTVQGCFPCSHYFSCAYCNFVLCQKCNPPEKCDCTNLKLEPHFACKKHFTYKNGKKYCISCNPICKICRIDITKINRGDKAQDICKNCIGLNL